MTSILDVRRYPEARDGFRGDALWELVDGNRERLNLAHECVDRHVGKGTALRLQFADGRREEHDFGALAEWSSRFASLLEAGGIARGDRVAVRLEPSLAFYGAVFGTVKQARVPARHRDRGGAAQDPGRHDRPEDAPRAGTLAP